MLASISIKNYAIIDEIDIFFDKKLNIITGETGAGKSILLGALGLIIGKRADTSVLRNTTEKCTIEATFNIQNYNLQSFFDAHDLEYDNQTIIRREINTTGKSRAFINDIPTTLEVLKVLTENLIDIHAQGETQNLVSKFFFCTILDSLAKQQKELDLYTTNYKKYIALQSTINSLKETKIQQQKEYDFNVFLCEELSANNLDIEAYNSLENELNRLQNAELIKRNLAEAFQLIDGNDFAALNNILMANKAIGNIANYQNNIQQIHSELIDIIDSLKSITKNIEHIADKTEYNENEILELTEKQNNINKLLQKHQVANIEDLIFLQNNLQQQIDNFNHSNEQINILEIELQILKNNLQKQAKNISINRKKNIPIFEKNISATLQELGMPFGYVTLQQQTNEDILNDFGIDEIILLFSPNKGIAPKSLNEVGSGGEKSRLMLAVKYLVATFTALPTIIFDEIDTGISGEVALKVGKILQQLGNHIQIIAITHLPQVAAKANKHFFVYKKHDKAITYTQIKELNKAEKITELAIMLSGENPSKAALENAKILIEN